VRESEKSWLVVLMLADLSARHSTKLAPARKGRSTARDFNARPMAREPRLVELPARICLTQDQYPDALTQLSG
jgi:hypothetical protein